jgi:hypothetical protein
VKIEFSYFSDESVHISRLAGKDFCLLETDFVVIVDAMFGQLKLCSFSLFHDFVSCIVYVSEVRDNLSAYIKTVLAHQVTVVSRNV